MTRAPATEIGADDLPERGVISPEQYIDFLVERVAERGDSSLARSRSWQRGLGAWVMRLSPRTAGPSMKKAEPKCMARPMRQASADSKATRTTASRCSVSGAATVNWWRRQSTWPCPAQEVEGLSAVNADFWHQVRQSLGRAKHGTACTSLAGRVLRAINHRISCFAKPPRSGMRKLRGLSRLDELARRIVAAWDEAYAGAEAGKAFQCRARPQGGNPRITAEVGNARRICSREVAGARVGQ